MRALVLLFVVFSFLNLRAQVEETSILDIAQVELENEVTGQSSDITIFNGNNNVVVLEQQGINELNAYIRGSNNVLQAFQKGEFNLLSAKQNGSKNTLSSTIRGSYNSVDITQNGNNNYFFQNLDNFNYSLMSVSQSGSNHRLTYTGEDQIGLGLDVKMTGNGMTVLIETNN